MKFRKKPVVIDAIQWTGMNHGEIKDFLGDKFEGGGFSETTGDFITIHTLEGNMRADQNDWIIRGVKGEFYPCKPDIFEATYEAVGEETGK